VIYDHKDFPIPQRAHPRISNGSRSLREVLTFLASGETIVTSSYHGAYWGQLLGRKVIAIPFSSKFEGFRFPLVRAQIESWEQRLKEPQAYPEALPLSREANLNFAEKVSNLLNISLTPISPASG
jgi:hypothetical protein